MTEQLALVFRAIKAGEFDNAEQALHKIISEYPDRNQNYYLLAAVLATRNKQQEALDMLSLAIDKGFRNSEFLQKDPNLKSIRSTSRFQELSERVLKAKALNGDVPPPQIAPFSVRDREVLVSSENTIWNPRFSLLLSQFDFPPASDGGNIVQRGDSPVARQLNEWYRRGFAAGNNGDLYDNRDHQHSALQNSDFPQLSFIRYSDEAKKAGIDYGLNTNILFNSIVLGNSSTAVTGGPLWRCQARLATTLPAGAAKLYLQYLNNHLYIYPAVDDYSEKNGDVLTANTPYMIVSAGKSGSDQPFLKAAASILAAFKPDVKDYLAQNRLIMPTLQMLLREGQISLRKSDDYLSYRAHPPVFDSLNLDMIRIIRMAQELDIKDVPPMVSLNVVSASSPQKGIDDFSTFHPQALFATPSAISRAVRSSAMETKLTVSAESTKTPVGQKLEYHWVVLRGDAKRISIKSQNTAGSVVEIIVPWHDPFPAPDRPDLTTSRVEIGAFVHNGKYFSAPSFINFLYPTNQIRTYNDRKQIVMIDHQSAAVKDRYVDPQVFTWRDWRDDFSYDDKGNLVGWKRTRDGSVENFTRDGARIIETDTLGRAVTAEIVDYNLNQKLPGRPVLVEQGTNRIVRYKYINDNDKLGTLKPN
ncbi:MAG: hypothetical protein K9G33_01385 [Sneathiella sp.]|nr:hypothetical protein [Sneathiella sp.]